MDIEFNCNHCGQHLAVDAAGAGVSVPCPKCGQLLTVPAATSNPGSTPVPSSIPAKKKCPYCAEEILTDAIKCKHCGEFLSGKTAQAPVAVPPLLPLNQPPQRKTTERRSGGVMAPSFFRMVGRITAVANHHRGLAVGASIILMLCLGNLFSRIFDSPSKTDEQAKTKNQANTENTRRFTASFLRFSGLASSTWIVESCEDQKNGTQTFSGSGYMIFVSPAPHATFKGSGFVTGDRLTFRANFTGYETLHHANGETIRVESWWPINED